jgi:hypothetical protein
MNSTWSVSALKEQFPLIPGRSFRSRWELETASVKFHSQFSRSIDIDCFEINLFLYPLSTVGNKVAPIQAKVVLIHILRRFELFTPQKCEDIQMVFEVSAAPHPDILLSFKPRDSSKLVDR